MPKTKSSIFLIQLLIQFSLAISATRETYMQNTVQGRYLLSDDNCYVCDALSLDPQSRCCPERGEKFSCYGCNILSQCCSSCEFCVSCCLHPARELVLKQEIAKPVTAGTYMNVFDFCAGRCRHSSESVVHENAYVSEHHHCFSLPPSNFSGSTVTAVEARLNGINVITGSMKKYMSCKGACLESVGADQPAVIVDDAPKHLNPGACLYTRTQSMLSCDGSHPHTRRLCPCA